MVGIGDFFFDLLCFVFVFNVFSGMGEPGWLDTIWDRGTYVGLLILRLERDTVEREGGITTDGIEADEEWQRYVGRGIVVGVTVTGLYWEARDSGWAGILVAVIGGEVWRGLSVAEVGWSVAAEDLLTAIRRGRGGSSSGGSVSVV